MEIHTGQILKENGHILALQFVAPYLATRSHVTKPTFSRGGGGGYNVIIRGMSPCSSWSNSKWLYGN